MDPYYVKELGWEHPLDHMSFGTYMNYIGKKFEEENPSSEEDSDQIQSDSDYDSEKDAENEKKYLKHHFEIREGYGNNERRLKDELIHWHKLAKVYKEKVKELETLLQKEKNISHWWKSRCLWMQKVKREREE